MADLRPVLVAGVTKTQLKEAFAFNVIDRLTDTFEFHVPKDFGFAAKMLPSRGYPM